VLFDRDDTLIEVGRAAGDRARSRYGLTRLRADRVTLLPKVGRCASH
jgi:hypothetical protein